MKEEISWRRFLKLTQTCFLLQTDKTLDWTKAQYEKTICLYTNKIIDFLAWSFKFFVFRTAWQDQVVITVVGAYDLLSHGFCTLNQATLAMFPWIEAIKTGFLTNLITDLSEQRLECIKEKFVPRLDYTFAVEVQHSISSLPQCPRCNQNIELAVLRISCSTAVFVRSYFWKNRLVAFFKRRCSYLINCILRFECILYECSYILVKSLAVNFLTVIFVAGLWNHTTIQFEPQIKSKIKITFWRPIQ